MVVFIHVWLYYDQTEVSLMFDIGYSHVNICRMSAECLSNI